MKKHLWLIVVLAIGLAFTQSNDALAQKTLKLGHLNSFSGGTSLYGADSKRAMTIALEEINAKGGIHVGGERYLL
jgi:branched-chain amino acid transport system substrate-binding protein